MGRGMGKRKGKGTEEDRRGDGSRGKKERGEKGPHFKNCSPSYDTAYTILTDMHTICSFQFQFN